VVERFVAPDPSGKESGADETQRDGCQSGGEDRAADSGEGLQIEIAKKRGNSGMASAPVVTVTAPAITSARLAVVRSTKAPTGVCAMIAAMPPTPITKPIEAWSQWWVSRR
jgi:hypothetical protein